MLTAGFAFIALGLLLRPAQASDGKIALLNRVVVSADTIFLIDFLPLTTSVQLRDAAREIEIGRSPKAGSIRLITSAQLQEKIRSGIPLLNSLIVPAELRITRSCPQGDHTVLEQRVLAFLRHQNWADVPTRLEGLIAWPADICADDGSWEPAAAYWDEAQEIVQVRLRSAGTHNDFLAAIKMQRPNVIGKSSARVGPNPITGAVKVNGRRHPLLVRSGEQATLSFDQGTIHLSLPVICLQPGRAQESIRVREVGQNRVLRAVVEGTAQLRAIERFEVN